MYPARSSIAILLTTYNPEIKEIIGNIESYINQVGVVIVCDNSDRACLAFSLKEFCLNTIGLYYVSMNGNKGIAYAQNRGAEMAISMGYEYFIEMDQDSKLPSFYVERIIDGFNFAVSKTPKILGIGPLAASIKDGSIYHGLKKDCGQIAVKKTLSSGFFFSKSSLIEVGYKDESLFIDLVDWEWCWRAGSKGYTVIVDTSLVIEHMLGKGHKKILGFKVGMPAPIRHYYQYRNAILMLSRVYVPIDWKLRRIMILIFKILFYIFFSDSRLSRLKYISKGLIAGIFNAGSIKI